MKKSLRMILAVMLVLTMSLAGVDAFAGETGASGEAGAVLAASINSEETAGSGSAENDLSAAEISLNPAKALYSGTVYTPAVSVSLGGKILAEGTDCSISMPEMRDAGSYGIVVTGQGSYTGSKTAAFTISPIDVSGAAISLSRDISTADLTADRTAVQSSVLASIANVTLDGKDVGSWCTLSSKVNGSQVTITAATANADGMNVVESSVSMNFAVKTSMTDCEIGEISPVFYSGAEQTPNLKIKNKLSGAALALGTDYIVSYSNNVNAGTAAITVTGRGNYTGELHATFVIEPKDIFYCTAFYANGRESSAYTGSAVAPSVTVRDGYQNTLIENKDYRITYTKADGTAVTAIKNAGEYKVIVSGIGNYSGKISLDYEIGGTDIGGYAVTLKYAKVKADGKAKVPEIVSVVNGTTSKLTAADYEVSYVDAGGQPVTEMILPGKYTVVLKGKNRYSGSAYATFEIVGMEQEITVAKTSYKVYKKSKDFKIVPTCSGDSTGFTFVSSNPEVASVDANGVVDVHKLGRAKITVTTTGQTLYQAASEEIYVKVYPYKAVLTQKPWTDGAKKSFKVRWETQADVTYYQVRYSTSKTFKSGSYKTKNVNASSKNYATQSTTVTGLKSGKTYYVKVRAVKVAYSDSGSKIYYYGNWSGWKSVKTK